jgi:integrase
MTKSLARDALAAIVATINCRDHVPLENQTFTNFVNTAYLPFYRRKWKTSTAACNADRLKHHLACEFGERRLAEFTRTGLQDFLDRKAASGLSFSTVDHLRWDLRQIFEMALAEDYVRKNPAALLFTPNRAKRGATRVMNWGDVKMLFSVLDTREQLVCMLATVAGMRPGEVFGLKWRHIKEDHIEIDQRVYRGKIDTPKNDSARSAALSEGLRSLVTLWRAISGDPPADAWVFPSETLRTPLSKDNCWRRCIAPRLAKVSLGWVNFQVMRRTHASLMRELDIDPKTVADQLGHSVDVDLNVYARTALGPRKEALNAFESALRVM